MQEREEICTICRGTVNVNESDNYIRLKCQHPFHGNCIAQWFITNQKTCPLCRSNAFEEIKQDKAYEILLFKCHTLIYRIMTLYNNIIMIHTLLATRWPIDLYGLFVHFILFKSPLDFIDPWKYFSRNLFTDFITICLIAIITSNRCLVIYRASEYIIRSYLLPMLLIPMICSLIFGTS